MSQQTATGWQLPPWAGALDAPNPRLPHSPARVSAQPIAWWPVAHNLHGGSTRRHVTGALLLLLLLLVWLCVTQTCCWPRVPLLRRLPLGPWQLACYSG